MVCRSVSVCPDSSSEQPNFLSSRSLRSGTVALYPTGGGTVFPVRPGPGFHRLCYTISNSVPHLDDNLLGHPTKRHGEGRGVPEALEPASGRIGIRTWHLAPEPRSDPMGLGVKGPRHSPGPAMHHPVPGALPHTPGLTHRLPLTFWLMCPAPEKVPCSPSYRCPGPPTIFLSSTLDSLQRWARTML